MNNVYFEDLIIGEYRYVLNGTEMSNTLADLNTVHANGAKYSISGNAVLTGDMRGCTDCAANEKRLALGLSDKSRGVSGTIIFRRGMQGSQQILTATVMWSMRVYDPNLSAPSEGIALPHGDMVLVEQ